MVATPDYTHRNSFVSTSWVCLSIMENILLKSSRRFSRPLEILYPDCLTAMTCRTEHQNDKKIQTAFCKGYHEFLQKLPSTMSGRAYKFVKSSGNACMEWPKEASESMYSVRILPVKDGVMWQLRHWNLIMNCRGYLSYIIIFNNNWSRQGLDDGCCFDHKSLSWVLLFLYLFLHTSFTVLCLLLVYSLKLHDLAKLNHSHCLHYMQ